MKIAVGGKGGSGKTTLAGILARQLSRRGVHPLLAIDGDTNPNLALTLGIEGARTLAFDTIPREIAERVTDESGQVRSILKTSPDQILKEFGVSAPDDITLVLMGRVEHAGAG